VLALVCAVLGATASASSAAVSWKDCPDDDSLRCGTVTVPLDRSGRVPGTVKLHVEVQTARSISGQPRKGALVALAGGPGQPATLFTSDFVFAFGEPDGTRDIVTFDQRGTGRSGLLRCPSVERVTLLSGYPAAGEQCAQRLGDRRGFYTTSDTVEDLEAIRQAIGVPKLALYGASYGTKVALAYAERYPQHTERLLLDSVLPLDGPDPLYGDTLAAMARVANASCAGGCDFTENPGADLARLGEQLQTGPARGYLVNSNGRHVPAAIGSTRLFYLLLAGDFAPDIRAALPAAVYSAQRGDPAALLRLATLNESTGEPAPASEFSAGVYAATLCEESPLPWSRGAPFDARPAAAADAAAKRGPGAFTPLGAEAVLQTDLLALCARWPEATAAPAVPRPLPDVPTLILEGALDLRTPLEGALRVAQQLPHSTTITVPSTGHSTLGSDTSECTLNAIDRFLNGGTPRTSCPEPPADLVVDEPAPLALSEVDRMKGAPSSVARMLNAVSLTIDDVEQQSANQAIIAFTNDIDGPVRGGGLRDGRFRLGNTGTSIENVVYVPGVRVSGRLLNRAARIGTFRVSADGKRGVVSYRGGGIITGTFDGKRFRVRVPRPVDNTPPSISLGKARERADDRPRPRPVWPRPVVR
jgi:pimeloyl-ACP methyl ester carboxylesterase